MKSLILFVDRVLQKFTPDPFVIAVVLSFVTLGLACAFPPESDISQTAGERLAFVIESWGSGFWKLAEFTLQMSMILLGGFVVATSPPVQWLLMKAIGFVNSSTQAVLFCTLVALAASWINWGFGLVVGGVVALEVGKRVPQAPFRLLVASSYSGFLIWHGGLSGSIPLLVNTPGKNFSADLLGGIVPLSQTIFGPMNLLALGAMIVLLPLLNLFQLFAVGQEETELAAGQSLPPVRRDEGSWLEHTVFLPVLLVGTGLGYVCLQLWQRRFNLDLNSVNLIFFLSGLLLQGSPQAFVRSMTQAAPKIAPILIQYPLYAAIMSVLKETGLAAQISEFFVSFANKDTFPLMTFYSAGVINLFVPSGGGQWAVQAPIVVPAAQQLGADIPKTIMAVAWGDAWTNMAQPFWAVPLLTIAGLRIKDVLGFCLITLFASGVVLSLIFLLF